MGWSRINNHMIMWVHGAFCTPEVFDFMLAQLPPHDHVLHSYSANTPLLDNLANLEDAIISNNITKIVGHSYGGLMAAVMKMRGIVDIGVALAAPLAGFRIGNYFPITQTLIDTRSRNPIFSELRQHTFDERFLTIVGHQYVWSDGLVSVASASAIRGSSRADVRSTHWKCLKHPQITQRIADHLELDRQFGCPPTSRIV